MASDDPDFERKAAGIIGLYLNPPQHAAVFCVDEKSAIQALDRLDPVLPMSPGGSNAMDSNTIATAPFRFMPRSMCERARSRAKTAARHTSEEFVDFLGQVRRIDLRDGRGGERQHAQVCDRKVRVSDAIREHQRGSRSHHSGQREQSRIIHVHGGSQLSRDVRRERERFAGPHVLGQAQVRIPGHVNNRSGVM